MVRENQLRISSESNLYFCLSCDRHFDFLHGALNHCRNAAVHQGERCERCEWLFVSPSAYQSHAENSSHHNVCSPCNLDFDTPALLESHDVDVHNKCTPCDAYFRTAALLESHDVDVHNKCTPCDEYFRTAALLESHDVDVHNLCTECGRYFRNVNDLLQHKRIHLPLEIECLGCDRLFSEFSAMMIHLESGTCESGVDRDDIDDYIFSKFMGNRTYINQWNDHLRYQCPDCSSDFRFASGLCQHVASNACNQQPNITFYDLKECIKWRI